MKSTEENMTEDNVVSLFARQAASNQKPKKKDQKKRKKPVKTKPISLLPALEKIDLGSRHPFTGLKYGGYLPLICMVFIPELFGVLTPGQFKTYLYLSFLKWRYAEESGYVRASHRYLSRGTGLSRSAVLEHLNDLEALGLIDCLETNRNLGNLYRVSPFSLHQVQQEPENQVTGFQATDVRNSGHVGPEFNPPWPEKQAKDYSSLSPLSLSQHEGFQKRWKRLSKKAMERERGVIKSLLEAHPDDLEEIFKALTEIESTGKTYSGETCFSPIGLISTSWPAIKRIRQSRAANSNSAVKPMSESSADADQIRVSILNEIHQYLSSLGPQEREALHQTVVNEVQKARPNIGEVHPNSRIYQSFLETTAAGKLGLELPESN